MDISGKDENNSLLQQTWFQIMSN